MSILRETWRSIRTVSAPVRHSLGKWRNQASVQRSAPLAREDRFYKRRRTHVLVDLINEQCPERGVRVAEIGVSVGRSSCHLMKYCPQIEKLVALDLNPPPPDSPFWKYDRIEFVRGPSAQSALRFDDASFDLIFIDGDHTASGVLADLKAWVPKVKPGGIVAGHDYGSHTHPDVKPVVDDYFKDHPNPIQLDANRVFWLVN